MKTCILGAVAISKSFFIAIDLHFQSFIFSLEPTYVDWQFPSCIQMGRTGFKSLVFEFGC
jgi:hypothetical protein